jgi:hypothetical protein
MDLASYDRSIKPEDRKHWAFQAVRRPPVPAVNDRAWVRNPIDAFVLAKLEARGWKPSPAADSRSLLRRVYLDVVGLPPAPAEQAAYVKSPTSDALDRLIDDLLARKSHGERWARHWLDLVRYSDSNGYERDEAKPSVWRYRDYVVNAFNEDKPYNRFVLEQLAGDELPNATAETLIATGYCRLGPWDDEPADPREDRFDQLDDIASTTALAFMGLTLGCARCHDHKFDPLTQHDYYRLVAVFNPLHRPQNGRTELDMPLRQRSEIMTKAAHQPADARDAVRHSPLLAAATVTLPWTLALPLWSADGNTKRRPEIERGYFLVEKGGKPPATHLLIRGKAARPGPIVEPGVPAVLVEKQPRFEPTGPRTSLRRLTLARWLVSRDNPLTARVIVNRIWQHHFGEGLVRTPSDFGLKGDPPTHPELLDWLADWFMSEGWSIKKLHRLILTSNTYRMSKRWNPEYGAQDPEDRLLWRVPYRRLEVEAIRDSMLAVTGQLNPKMFGPCVYPPVPKEVLAAHSDPDKIWKPSSEREAARRTIYAFVKRSMVMPMLEVLDLCDTARSSAQRLVTTAAPQALTLFNGDFVNRQAEHLADRLVREAGPSNEQRLEHAYLLALCRPPSQSEQAAMARFLKEETEKLGQEASKNGNPMNARDAEHKALVQMCRVLFNLNEFVYTD